MAIPSITCPLKQVNSLNGPQVKTLVADNYPILISASSERDWYLGKWRPFSAGLARERREQCLGVGIYPTEISGDCPLSLLPILTLISLRIGLASWHFSHLLGAARHFP